jgi:phosphoenolpyruvate carboxykinase (GTP)
MATHVERWVEEQARLAKPKRIYWCDGTEEEARRLVEIGMTDEEIAGHKVFHELSSRTFPSSYLHRSHPTDVARTEHLTYVCHENKETTGPNNNWMDPKTAKEKLAELSDGCMRGRTMYVLPYMMGHPDSPYAKACIQITDSSYVAVSMRIMTRLGGDILKKIGASENFVKGFHSIGDLNPDRRFIMHFPLENLVWSVGSGYGGNALLGKKCFSLRIASWLGRNEGWLAEHMVVIGVEDPEGQITYITAAMPSACGKTNLAMLESAIPGYRIWTLGDDIAWLNIGPDGRLWAINPEIGFFGVAPGTSMSTNPNMIKTLKKGSFYPTLFTNVALDTDTNEPWWDGLDKNPPKNLLDWQGNPWTPESNSKPSHPNSRFTVSITHCPTLSGESSNPKGVPISAIIFGGRRKSLIPLVTESFDWQNGVFAGVRMGSETTAAATQKVGQLRRDPMAMLPFCGYDMASYFRHWLDMGKRCTHPPKIYSVNWFRADEDGNFIWPGFGDNIRVIKWIVDRTRGRVQAKETPIGLVPRPEDLDLRGLAIPGEKMKKLLDVNMDEWKEEKDEIKKFLEQFGDRVPRELVDENERLERSS